MNKKEQKLLLKVNQMDLWDLEEWQAGNPASSFSEEFIDEVNDLKEALLLISEKKVPVAEMITHRITLDEIQYGFDLVQNGLESLKVIVEPNGN